MSDETRSLHRKLAQIMYEAERIPKRGKAPAAMGGYPFVQVGDAADFIRKALAEKVLTMMPTSLDVVGMQDRPTKAGGTMTTLDIRVKWTITDGESGETIVVESYGAGADGGDKYSGKAMTNAMKYALLAGFMLSTGDDVELGHDEAGRPPRVPPPAQPPPDAEVRRVEITGIVSFGTSNQSDGRLRETPTGWVLGFNLTTGPRQWTRVLVRDDMALRLAHGDIALPPSLPLKVFGPIEKAEDHVGDRIVRYQRVTAEKITADEWELPAETHGAGPSPDAAGVPSAEPTAEPSAPHLFDDEAERQLDAIPL